MPRYSKLLEPLFPDISIDGIVAYIRIERPNIEEISLEDFVTLAEKAVCYERVCPGFLSDLMATRPAL